MSNNVKVEYLYGFTEVVNRILELKEEGCEILPDDSYLVGVGNYNLAYIPVGSEITSEDDSEKSQEEEKEDQNVPQVKEEEAQEEDPEAKEESFEQEVDESPQEEQIVAPDWAYVKTFLADSENEKEAKEKLIAYAGTFGISEDSFDRRKGFSRLQKVFSGKWTQVKKG